MLLTQGNTALGVSRHLGIFELTYYRRRNEYSGMKGNQAKRLEGLEKETAQLKRLVADLNLDKQILEDAAKANF